MRILFDGVVDAGERVVRWDGSNDRGSAVASGIYFVRFETDRDVFTRKLILARERGPRERSGRRPMARRRGKTAKKRLTEALFSAINKHACRGLARPFGALAL